MTLVLVLGVVLWLAAVGAFWRSGVASLFHPAGYYLFFHGLVFVVRPILGAYYGYSYIYRVFQFSPSDGERITALLVADVGLVAFMAAVLFVGRERLVLRGRQRGIEIARRRFPGAMWLAVALCAGPAIYSTIFVVTRKLGDSGDMVLDAGTGAFTNTSANGYLTDSGNMLIPIVVLVAWYYRFRPLSLLPFAVYMMARLLNGGGRWSFVMATASMALAYLYDRRRQWPEWRTIALGVMAMALFTVVGANRAFFAEMVSDQVAVSEKVDFLAPLEDEHYANQEMLEYLVYIIPERTQTYGWFLDNLQVLTEPIPRVLWPGKPVGPPIQLYKLFDYGFPIGMTYSLPGEGWAQAGWIGVMLWCGLFGVMCGKAYNWFARSMQTEFQVACYILLLPLSIQLFRDGQLITALRFPLFYLVPIALWWLFAYAAGRRVRRVTDPQRLIAARPA